MADEMTFDIRVPEEHEAGVYANCPVRRPGDDQPLPFPEGFVQNGDDEDEETP